MLVTVMNIVCRFLILEKGMYLNILDTRYTDEEDRPVVIGLRPVSFLKIDELQ